MNERNVRKIAIKMTALYMARNIAMQASWIALVLLFSKAVQVQVEVGVKFLIILMAVLDIPLTLIIYSECKKEVISWKEEEEKQEDEQNK